MTTSENHIGKVHEATQAGASNYLVKPCAADRLKQRLERALMWMSPPIAAWSLPERKLDTGGAWTYTRAAFAVRIA